MENFIVNYFSTSPFSVIYEYMYTIGERHVQGAYAMLFSAYSGTTYFGTRFVKFISDNMQNDICYTLGPASLRGQLIQHKFSQNFNKMEKEFLQEQDIFLRFYEPVIYVEFGLNL